MEELCLLQTIVEEAPIAMAFFEGEAMTVRLINKAMQRFWKNESEYIGQPYHEIHNNFATPRLEELMAVYHSGESFEALGHRIEVCSSGGMTECYLNLNLKPIKNACGEIYGILYAARDITAMMHVQQEAQKKETKIENDKRFHNLIDHAPVAVGTLRGWDMKIASANQYLLDFWGKDESVIGLPLVEAVPDIQHQVYLDLLREVYTTGKPYYGYELFSQIYRKKHQDDLYFNIVFQPEIGPGNVVNKILLIAHDVTTQVKAKLDLEESKNRFKSLILEAPMPTAIFVGREIRVSVINEAMLKHWGKGPEVIGLPLKKILPELEGQSFFELLDNVYTSGETYHSNETRADLLVDGEIKTSYFNFTYKPLLDAEGKVYGIINMSVDVTSQVNARLELEELSRKKDEFLSVASHELKTPLTSLKASMQLINKLVKTDPLSAVIPVFIHKANTSLIKILHLIDDLMHVSKTQHGLLPLNKTWFKLAELVNECCDHIRAENNHELIFEGDPELMVFADQARIDQVVVNFVNNAVKYAPGSKKIILKIEKLRGEAKVSIQDFGIGILHEKQEHLFERYYRVDYSGIQFSGLGLGLYIVAEIIERHGGKIGVNSKIGEGSTFWFTLPL